MARATTTILAATALGLAIAPAIPAGPVFDTLLVNVQVSPSAQVRFQLEPGALALDDADIARGYVDSPPGLAIVARAGRIKPAVRLLLPGGGSAGAGHGGDPASPAPGAMLLAVEL